MCFVNQCKLRQPNVRNDVLTWEGVVDGAKVAGEEFKFCIWNGRTHEYVWEEQGPMHAMPMVDFRFSASGSDFRLTRRSGVGFVLT